jgi:hypothetical protein
MTNDKLTGKLARWALILQEYEFKVIHRPSITHQNADTMSRRSLTTSEDFSETKQDFDQIPTVHVSEASSYFALLQCNLVEHLIFNIWEDLDTLRFLQHGEYLPQVSEIAYNNGPNSIHGGRITRPMLTTRRQNGSTTT